MVRNLDGSQAEVFKGDDVVSRQTKNRCARVSDHRTVPRRSPAIPTIKKMLASAAAPPRINTMRP